MALRLSDATRVQKRPLFVSSTYRIFLHALAKSCIANIDLLVGEWSQEFRREQSFSSLAYGRHVRSALFAKHEGDQS